MFKDLLEIIETYRKVIIPALENKQIELNMVLINTFLQFVNTVYANTSYDGHEQEQALRLKLEQYYNENNYAGIIGIFYSFIDSAAAILSLQYLVDDTRYKVYTKMSHIANCQKNYCWKQTHDFDETERFTGKGVIYSAITGDYDILHEPLVRDPNFDYILFTNNSNIKSDFWQIIYLDNPDLLDNIRLARHVKIRGYEYLTGYDYSVWVDGKIQIIGDIKEFIKNNKGSMPILCMPHYNTCCVYDEEAACESLKKDNAEIMQAQISRYRDEAYPKNFGMIDSCILVRELKNDTLNKLMDTWWNEVKNESYRDQLSFNYSCWKNDFIYDTADIFCYKNPYFQLHNHS